MRRAIAETLNGPSPRGRGHLTGIYQIADSNEKRGVGWKSDPPRN